MQLLTLGALLAPGKRTITSVLRIVGLNQDQAFHKYHRVLSHARWSARTASQLLLHQLLNQFIGQQPLVVGIDETLEQRWGPQMKARAIFVTQSAVVRAILSSVAGCGG